MTAAKASKGLLIVYTGNGKGKTTAALGTAFRAIGHGMKVCVVSFLKGDWPASSLGELKSARRHRNLCIAQTGRGFVGICGDKLSLSSHKTAAEKAWALAKRCANQCDLLVLDEVFCALKGKLLSAREVQTFLKNRPKSLHVIMTGRYASSKFIRMADLVTEMKEIKHPFQKKIPAQKGIDY